MSQTGKQNDSTQYTYGLEDGDKRKINTSRSDSHLLRIDATNESITIPQKLINPDTLIIAARKALEQAKAHYHPINGVFHYLIVLKSINRHAIGALNEMKKGFNCLKPLLLLLPLLGSNQGPHN